MRTVKWITVLALLVAHPALAQSMPAYLASPQSCEIDLMIGGDIDDEENFLFQPTDLALDADGNLFVLDTKGFCIKKFDPEGKHLATFGREGEGPGEMERAHHIALDPEGNVVIHDSGQRRFTTFSPDGVPRKTIGLHEFGDRFITNLRIGPRGAVYVTTQWHDWMDLDGPSQYKLMRIDLDTLEETPIDSALTNSMYALRNGSTMRSVGAPFPPYLRWGVAPSGKVVVCNSDDYVIKIYSPELRLLSEHRHDVDRAEVTAADRKAYLEAFEEGAWRDMARDAPFPKFKPYFVSMHIDDRGYLLFQMDGDDETVAVYDVFSPDGVFIDQVELPPLRESAVITGDAIYNIELYEEESLVVYRYRHS